MKAALKKIFSNKGIVIILIAIMIAGNLYSLFMDYNKQMELRKYLDEEVREAMPDLIKAIGENGQILTTILENERLKYEQADILRENYLYKIDSFGLVIADWGFKFEHIDNPPPQVILRYSTSYPYGQARRYYPVISQIIRKHEVNEEEYVEIKGDDQRKIELIKEINDTWMMAIKNNIEGYDDPERFKSYYESNMIRQINDWNSMIEEVIAETARYDKETYLYLHGRL